MPAWGGKHALAGRRRLVGLLGLDRDALGRRGGGIRMRGRPEEEGGDQTEDADENGCWGAPRGECCIRRFRTCVDWAKVIDSGVWRTRCPECLTPRGWRCSSSSRRMSPDGGPQPVDSPESPVGFRNRPQTGGCRCVLLLEEAARDPSPPKG